MAALESSDRITIEPGKCGGKATHPRDAHHVFGAYWNCWRPTRIEVHWLAEYPFLEPEYLRQVLHYACRTAERASRCRVTQGGRLGCHSSVALLRVQGLVRENKPNWFGRCGVLMTPK